MIVQYGTDTALGDLAMRLIAGNGLSITMLEQIVGRSPEAIAALEFGCAKPLEATECERLALFCAILIRFEIRLGHEPRAVREIIDTPQAGLDGRTPLAVMTDGIDGLRTVHRIVGEMALPEARWWRVGHNR